MEDIIKKYLRERALASDVAGYLFVSCSLKEINYLFQKDNKTFVCFVYERVVRSFNAMNDPGVYKLSAQIIIEKDNAVIDDEEIIAKFVANNDEVVKKCKYYD